MNRPITIDGTPVITSAMNEMSLAERALAAVLVDVDRAEHAERDRDERGEAGDLQRADDRRRPCRRCPSGMMFGGIVPLVRNCQLIALAPLAITVTSTKPSGTRASTKAAHMSDVAIWFLVRRQPPGSRRSTAPSRGLVRQPSGAPSSAARSAPRSPRATRLTRIVSTNRNRPRPISAERNSPRGLAELVAR